MRKLVQSGKPFQESRSSETMRFVTSAAPWQTGQPDCRHWQECRLALILCPKWLEMAKNKKKTDRSPAAPPEKHPLEKLPEPSENELLSEEDLDRIPVEEEEESPPPDAPPPPGEGP